MIHTGGRKRAMDGTRQSSPHGGGVDWVALRRGAMPRPSAVSFAIAYIQAGAINYGFRTRWAEAMTCPANTDDVIAPTPPGTGVMAATIGSAS